MNHNRIARGIVFRFFAGIIKLLHRKHTTVIHQMATPYLLISIKRALLHGHPSLLISIKRALLHGHPYLLISIKRALLDMGIHLY